MGVERPPKHDVKRSTHHEGCPRVLHPQRKISDTSKSGVAERNLCYSLVAYCMTCSMFEPLLDTAASADFLSQQLILLYPKRELEKMLPNCLQNLPETSDPATEVPFS